MRKFLQRQRARSVFNKQHLAVTTGQTQLESGVRAFRARCLCTWQGPHRQDVPETRGDMTEHLRQAWEDYTR